MKSAVCFLALLGLAYCLPQGDVIGLIRDESSGINEDGSYNFAFESEDGITREEAGRLKAEETYEQTGSYSYTAPDGTFVEVTYIADELGYRPRIVIEGGKK